MERTNPVPAWHRKPSLPPHSVESCVRRALLSNPDFSVSSLVVRRIPNGVCLEGIVHLHDGQDGVNPARVNDVARRVLGVKEVQNHLLVCHDEDCANDQCCESVATCC